MPWKGEGFSGGMKLRLSKHDNVSSRLFALNSDVLLKTQSVCRLCPVANGKIENAECYGVSGMNGIAYFSLNGTSLEKFLEGAACKINQVEGVDLEVPNKINPSEFIQIFG